MELFNAFGIDLKNLLFNLVNFAVLYAVLFKLGYKPILKFVKDRTEKIEKGVKDAETAQQALVEAKSEYEKMVADGHKQAQEIIQRAKEQAQVQAAALLEKNKTDLVGIAQRAKQQIHDERERMLREAQEQAVELVLAATEKVLMDKLDVTADTKYIERIVAEVK